MRAILRNFGVSAALLILSSPALSSIAYKSPVYHLSGGLGADPDASVSFSITTDGTIGAIGTSNVIDYSVEITQGGALAELVPANAGFFEYNTSGVVDNNGMLTATLSTLSFSFDPTSLSGIVIFNPIIRGPFVCFQNAGCTNFAGSQIQASIDVDAPFAGSPYITADIGTLVIATAIGVADVPEPASWAMFIGGFGLIGSTIRRGKKIRVGVFR